jgi:hypothetical protein
MVMKSTIFWDITSCSPLSVNRRFGGTYRLHLRGRKNKLCKKPTWKQVANRICSPLSVKWRFGGTYRLQLQGRKNKLWKKPVWKQVANRVCSPLSVNRRFGETYRLPLQGRKNKLWKKPVWRQVANRICSPLIVNRNKSCLPAHAGFSLSLFFRPWRCSSETSVDTQRTTRLYIPEDGTLHNHRCENLKSYNISWRKPKTTQTRGMVCHYIYHSFK